MGLVINTNVSSLIAQRQLYNNTQNVNRSFEKLSSGLRINRASDDAAGLNISENLKTQIRGNEKSISNAQDGVNVLQIAEGALNVISENLQRIRELTVQGANDTNSSRERKAISMEIQSRVEDINRIAQTTRSNNINLLDGTATTFHLQVGANSNQTQNTTNIGSVFVDSDASALGITSTITTASGGVMESNSQARAFLDEIDSALNNVLTRRAQIGAFQNRLESSIESLSIANENFQATNSRIRNLDIAAETAKLTQLQILQQSAVGIMSQANQAPNLALRLLG